MRKVFITLIFCCCLFVAPRNVNGATVGSSINAGLNAALKASLKQKVTFNSLAQTMFIAFKSSLPANLRTAKLETNKLSKNDWQSLRLYLDGMFNGKNLRALSIIPAQFKTVLNKVKPRSKVLGQLKLAVATLFVAHRSIGKSDWFDCTTRTCQIHAQAMYLARYENFYSHPGSKVVKDSRGRKKYVTERMNWRHVLDGNGNLQGTGIGNVFARRTYLSAMYQKNKAPVKWLNGWRNVLPWDKRVRIGDIVANMRKDGKIFHVGTVVFSDPRLRIAAVVESYLRKDNKGKILKTPTNLWVYYDKTNNRSLSRGFAVPGFEEHRALYRTSSRAQNHFGAYGLRIGRYKDQLNVQLSAQDPSKSPIVKRPPVKTPTKKNSASPVTLIFVQVPVRQTPIGQTPVGQTPVGQTPVSYPPVIAPITYAVASEQERATPCPVCGEIDPVIPCPVCRNRQCEQVIISDPSGMKQEGYICGNDLVYVEPRTGEIIIEEVAPPSPMGY